MSQAGDGAPDVASNKALLGVKAPGQGGAAGGNAASGTVGAAAGGGGGGGGGGGALPAVAGAQVVPLDADAPPAGGDTAKAADGGGKARAVQGARVVGVMGAEYAEELAATLKKKVMDHATRSVKEALGKCVKIGEGGAPELDLEAIRTATREAQAMLSLAATDPEKLLEQTAGLLVRASLGVGGWSAWGGREGGAHACQKQKQNLHKPFRNPLGKESHRQKVARGLPPTSAAAPQNPLPRAEPELRHQPGRAAGRERGAEYCAPHPAVCRGRQAVSSALQPSCTHCTR